ncbi:M12 family metallo-peptidase [Methylicorpusculum oleiharenae]|uniref:M12 family metallo-peptidase n=1 Tax=Methylicorpusculum oleiharenae TaxID=1338687 RepID=UPI00135B5B8B|nr:M12 family metallo-peptidase [Methylicorpusculum oleiharenae]MCD2449904.1 M12 family metallo-peptidase [Methylicorpusculum oleiharenae]
MYSSKSRSSDKNQTSSLSVSQDPILHKGMNFNIKMSAVMFISALIPFTSTYAQQVNNPVKAGVQNIQKKGHFAPELFDDFGITQSTKKVLPTKAIKGRNRSVKVNTDILWSDSLTLTLFDDVVVTVIRDRLIDKVKGSTTWIGHVAGESNSEVFLTVRGSNMSGTVSIGDDLYEINLGANDLHEITKVDPARNPDHGDDAKAVEDFIAEGGEIDTTGSSEPVVANAEINAGTVIDVMVVYTPQSRINAYGQSGIEAKIVNAVAKANQSYINSQIDMQINLVHMAEVSYVESGSTSTSLSDITGTSDGKMDAVHTLRNQYGADQVVLITTDTSACGTGYLMSSPSTSFASYAFSVVHDDSKYACLSNHTLAHELGHNQGSHHDRASATSTPAYDYSYGYRLCQTGGFRTVMSYDCSGGTRVGYFSNPKVTFNGEYTGTATEDNARSMTNTKAIVAAFRGTVDKSLPVAPSGLAALMLSDKEISISWADNSGNETGFRLERSMDGVNWTEFAVVGVNVRSFTDAGLVANTTYQYRIRAYNSNGTSSYSNIGSATTKAAVTQTCINNSPALSLAPTAIYTMAGATVSFNIALANQDSSVCGATLFNLSNSEGGAIGSYTLSPGASTSTSWMINAPTIDGSYTKSVTASAVSHSSVTKSATIIVDGTAPTAPGNLKVAIKRNSQVAISWSASTDSGSGLDRYVVSRNGVRIATLTTTNYTDKPGTGVMTYTVEAFDKVGNVKGSSTSITVGGTVVKDRK